MSEISKIYSNYGDSLRFSQQKYNDLYSERAENAAQFQEAFFNKLMVSFTDRFDNSANRRRLHRRIDRFFGSTEIDFVAIDGTNFKDPFQDFIVFFACAYGSKGQINLTNDPPQIRYKRWALEKDVSMVTYVPIPFAEFADVVDQDRLEDFLVSDGDYINFSNIDTQIMALAEVYLAYNVASSSLLDAPKMILMDRSPSSMIADVAINPETLPMLDYEFDRRRLTVQDARVVMAHPFNRELKVPSLKKFRQYAAIIAEMHHQRTNKIDIAEFASQNGVKVEDLQSAIRFLTREENAPAFGEITGTTLATNVDVRSSWDFCVGLFEDICRRLFIEKDQEALIYEAKDENGVLRMRWMSPDDIRFLTAIGIRALIEKCWDRKILLTGIIKDSASRYLTRNYLGVMKLLGQQGYPELSDLEVKLLPWTDRIFLELLPLLDDSITAPWSTIEFDSTFMTVHARLNEMDNPIISGARSVFVAPERLFARSLGQFFLKRDKASPLMGHVVFIDRLIFPELDEPALDNLTIKSNLLGQLNPLCYRTQDDDNIGQDINMYLLSVLTRNHFPEVIGYPDPLHKADWGAKSVGERARKLIASSTFSFRSQPLSRTFRDIRDSHRR